jgi:hypothetical protein
MENKATLIEVYSREFSTLEVLAALAVMACVGLVIWWLSRRRQP